MTSSWVGDPDKYAELSKPFETQEEAEKVAQAFFNAVRTLREQYRIAELTMQAQVYVGDADKPEEQKQLSFGGGWGNQLQQARLAKRSADNEINHLLAMTRLIAQATPENDGTELGVELVVTAIEQLLAVMPEARRGLITDPKFDGGVQPG